MVMNIPPEKVRSLQQLFNSLIADKTRENLPKYALLAGAGCSVTSDVASGRKIIDILQKYTYLIQSDGNDNALLAAWNHRTETIEEFISKVQNSIDADKLQQYILHKQSQFRQQLEELSMRASLVDTLPNNLKGKYPDVFCRKDDGTWVKKPNADESVVWQDYSKHFFEELQYGFWMYEFSPQSDDIQNLIESFIERKDPAVEYYLFADLVAKGLMYTTNFDDFFQETLSFLGLRARICFYEDKADIIDFNREKPNIIKLHGDYLYNNTRNYNNETSELHKSLKAKFQEALHKFGIIVIGYAGNDYSIMSVLEELKETTNYPLYWCILESDLQANNIPWRVRELVLSSENSYFVPIRGFREFVELLWKQWYQVETMRMREPHSFIVDVRDKAAELSFQLKSILRSKDTHSVLPPAGISIDEIECDYSGLQQIPERSPFVFYDSETVNIQKGMHVHVQEATQYYSDLDVGEKRNCQENN